MRNSQRNEFVFHETENQPSVHDRETNTLSCLCLTAAADDLGTGGKLRKGHFLLLRISWKWRTRPLKLKSETDESSGKQQVQISTAVLAMPKTWACELDSIGRGGAICRQSRPVVEVQNPIVDPPFPYSQLINAVAKEIGQRRTQLVTDRSQPFYRSHTSYVSGLVPLPQLDEPLENWHLASRFPVKDHGCMRHLSDN